MYQRDSKSSNAIITMTAYSIFLVPIAFVTRENREKKFHLEKFLLSTTGNELPKHKPFIRRRISNISEKYIIVFMGEKKQERLLNDVKFPPKKIQNLEERVAKKLSFFI